MVFVPSDKPNEMLTPPMSHWHFYSSVDADFTFVDSEETERITESKFESSGRITFSPVKDSFAKNFHSVSFQVCVARGLFAVAHIAAMRLRSVYPLSGARHPSL